MDDCPLTTAKRTVEKAVQASGMVYTILCPCIFMEVWLSPALGFAYPDAKATIYGDGHAKNRFISLGDVAQYAVESLSNPAARNAILELGSPQPLSFLEVVRIFEKTGGKSFELQFVPAAALAAQRAAATDPLQASFATMMLNLTHGILVDSTRAQKAFSFPLVSVEDYARRVMPVTTISPDVALKFPTGRIMGLHKKPGFSQNPGFLPDYLLPITCHLSPVTCYLIGKLAAPRR